MPTVEAQQGKCPMEGRFTAAFMIGAFLTSFCLHPTTTLVQGARFTPSKFANSSIATLPLVKGCINNMTDFDARRRKLCKDVPIRLFFDAEMDLPSLLSFVPVPYEEETNGTHSRNALAELYDLSREVVILSSDRNRGLLSKAIHMFHHVLSSQWLITRTDGSLSPTTVLVFDTEKLHSVTCNLLFFTECAPSRRGRLQPSINFSTSAATLLERSSGSLSSAVVSHAVLLSNLVGREMARYEGVDF